MRSGRQIHVSLRSLITLDGHISDVYVFGVTAADAGPTLFYHTPDLHTYDVKWEVAGWDASRRQIVLDKEVKQKTPGKITTRERS